MWPESSPVNPVNLVEKSGIIPEIRDYYFLARPVHIQKLLGIDFQKLSSKHTHKHISGNF